MIDLKDDRLTFTFPEITRQLTALLEQHIQQLLPKLPLPVDRNQLVEAMYQQIEESGGTLGLRHDVPLVKPKPLIFMKNGRELPQSRYQSLDDTAKSLTAADVEKAVRALATEVIFAASVTFEFQRTTRIPDD